MLLQLVMCFGAQLLMNTKDERDWLGGVHGRDPGSPQLCGLLPEVDLAEDVAHGADNFGTRLDLGRVVAGTLPKDGDADFDLKS